MNYEDKTLWVSDRLTCRIVPANLEKYRTTAKQTDAIASEGAHSKARFSGKRKLQPAQKKPEPSKPEVPPPPESCYVPFRVGDRVRLRIVPSRKYLVEQVWTAVDLSDASAHLRPGRESVANHLYQLRRDDQEAYWYHSQLEQEQA